MLYINENNNLESCKGNDLIFPNRDNIILDFINLLNKSGTTKRHLFNLFLISVDMAYYFGVMFGKDENLEKDKQQYRISIMKMDGLRSDNKILKKELEEKEIKIKELQKVVSNTIL